MKVGGTKLGMKRAQRRRRIRPRRLAARERRRSWRGVREGGEGVVGGEEGTGGVWGRDGEGDIVGWCGIVGGVVVVAMVGDLGFEMSRCGLVWGKKVLKWENGGGWRRDGV